MANGRVLGRNQGGCSHQSAAVAFFRVDQEPVHVFGCFWVLQRGGQDRQLKCQIACDFKPAEKTVVEAHQTAFQISNFLFRNFAVLNSLDTIRRAIRLKPLVAEYHHLLGMGYERSGKPEAAIEAQKRAVELEPDNTIYHQLLAESYVDLKEYELAEVVQKKSAKSIRWRNRYHHLTLEGSNIINASRDRIWRILNDPVLIAKHLPGCESLESVGEDTYRAVFKIQAGPIKKNFAATLQISGKQPPAGYSLRLDAGFASGE
ncbi:MAG: tetratricopeptide repeat protein, partial [Planctomycetes bacterium]|nr:tetratricopeptide repeat protein [Planctomycetota bacterium]